ncbi:cuticle protein 16.5 [Halyomorpha halys]|uniref:cuticle protein 16.5 n=1 Tax=Halyomorpha halys TaxID=286706 RepID=UPI0006D4DC84|nr:cuticle protein 12.5-like [Halyomorpha halys]
MQYLVVLFAAFAAASASGLLGAAPLLPKVQVGPTQVNVVRQPYTIEEPVPVHRTVPVPVKAIAHTAPIVETPVVAAAPVAYAASYAAPLAYGAPVAAPLAYSGAHWGYGVPALAARTIAAPGIIGHSTILAH